MKFTSLAFFFLKNQSAVVADTGQKESGFSTPDNEKPIAQSCKKTWTSKEQMAWLLLHEKDRI